MINIRQKSAIDNLSSSWLHITIIFMTGFIAYANSFSVPMQFDDFTTIGSAIDNYSQGGFAMLSPGSSRWVADASFALNKHIHNFHVGGYHAVNLFIHFNAALIIYFLLDLLLAAPAAATTGADSTTLSARVVPFSAALLFICHPIQTEAITYISQRYTSIAALFYLAALFSYVRARRNMVSNQLKSSCIQNFTWWLAFVFFAILAMKCKQTSVTLPLMTATLEAVWFRGYLLKKPVFVILLSGLFLIVPVQEFYSHHANASSSVTDIINQASSETNSISRYSYFLTQQRVEVTYLRLLLCPVRQNLDYDYPVFTTIASWLVIASLMLHLSLLGLAIYFIIVSKRSSACHPLTAETVTAMRLAATGIVWFYLTLSVESSFIPIRDVIFEHRLYLPSAGFLTAFTAGGVWMAAQRNWRRRAAIYLFVMLTIALTASTIYRNRVWSSELSLWQDVLEKSPNKARAESYVGLYYAKRFVLDKAIRHLVRAVELEQGNNRNYIYLNNTVALIRGFEKRSSNGMKYQSGTESVDPALISPWMAVSYNDLGLAYEFLNMPLLAKNNYFEAIRENPDLDIAWYNLSLLALKNHDSEGYKQASGKVAQLNPELHRSLPEPTANIP
jgi:tetratricopeptide (TPR) repeat protein